MLFACKQDKSHFSDKDVFRYNEAAGISSLDPAFAKNLANIWACNQIYNGLVELNEKLIVKPSIAKSWEVKDSGRLYLFTLRDDVYFHDHEVFDNGKGRKVNAYDFVYSFRRISDPNVASPGAWVFENVQEVNKEKCFKAINDSVFEIRLKKAFPPFPGILTMKYCSVVPYEIIEYYKEDFRKAPIGTGPFRFKFWKEGVKLVLRKNDHYFEFDKQGNRLPYLESVAVSFLLDKQSAFLEFVKGNFDFMSGIDASYKDEILGKDGKLNKKYTDRFYLISEPYLNTEYLAILSDTSFDQNSPLNNLKVRKAINHGFDRHKMIRYLRNNIGTPGNYGIIPPGLPSFDSMNITGYEYMPDLSIKLLKEAGFENGKGLGDITLSTTAEYLDICKYVQHQLSEIGVSIEIDVNPPATLKELKAQSKLKFFRASWIADYPDAENYLSLFYTPNFAPQGPNYTHFSNSYFDELFRESQNEIIDSIRYRTNQEMDKLIMQQSPVVILYYDQVLRFISKKVSGLGSNPINLLDLREVRKK